MTSNRKNDGVFSIDWKLMMRRARITRRKEKNTKF
jgi:hypothetical protein